MYSDKYVEQTFGGASVDNIFSQCGENLFRDYEVRQKFYFCNTYSLFYYLQWVLSLCSPMFLLACPLF